MATRIVRLLVGLVLLLSISVYAHEDDDRRSMHPNFPDNEIKRSNSRINPLEDQISYWRNNAQEHLSNRLRVENNLNENQAKNVIMFLGDGMSLPTVAATRMYLGSEEEILSFEKFPHFGLSKTYCVDRQVADSACTATAFLSGVKANYGTMGITAAVDRYDCDGERDESRQTKSIIKWAQDACKATGFVTTSRVTHATPGGVYSHTANRYSENDVDIVNNGCDPTKTIDIARQLIMNEEAQKLKVILGGGRREFRDRRVIDEEGEPGIRNDGLDLIEQWLSDRSANGTAKFIWNEQSLKSLDYANTDYLLGLFEADHCMYNVDIENNQLTDSEPSLSEMVEGAIKMLSKYEHGYFLFVESARIDMAHHETWARKALDETKEFSNVIDMARRMTNDSDTLIVVTSDHAHVMTYNGYTARGNGILGLSGRTGSDGKPYSTLSYANGMGYYNTYENGVRKDVSELNYQDPDLMYMATAPRDSETHGGDDVGVYASGPWSHLFVGNYEQNNIPVAMAFAAKIGPYLTGDLKCSGGAALQVSFLLVIVVAVIRLIVY